MAESETSDIVVVGARAHPLRDAYHLLLRMRWPGVLGIIAGAFLFLNLLFALAYRAADGIHGARPGSLADAFYFSVQTMGTIGYGAMYPETPVAHALVVGESVVGLILTALATGIIFARFSQASSVIVFSRFATIAPMDGIPTLSFRIGNDRGNGVVEATVRVVAIRTEKTREGITFYRMYDMVLTRERSPLLARSWTVMHPIVPGSPLHGQSPGSCDASELELSVSVVGTDDTSLQPVHGRYRYLAKEIVWGARLADVLDELPDGRLRLDVGRFHDIVPTEPTDDFPHPKLSGAPRT